MFFQRTRQALVVSALLLCNNGIIRAQLRVAQQKTQTQALETGTLRQQQEQRELGNVIFVGGKDSETENFKQNFIEYDLELPVVRSGPVAGESMIDVGQKKKPKSHELGYDALQITDRVVGGQGVKPRSYYAMLLYRDSAGWKFAGCGATLITNCHVVTAAHCVEDRNFDIEGIYNNAHTPYSGNSNYPFHFTTASRIFVPQEYDDYTNVNDIAVIRMSQCLNLTEYPPAVPASPYNNRVSSGDMLELYGFGRVGENVGQSGDTKQLQMARIPYITNSQCKNYFGNKIKYGMFCAGYSQGGIDACQGDSGSGIFSPPQNANDPAVLMGVVSWGVGCARKGYPGVYAKVEDFYEWIKTNVCNDPELDSSITWCSDAKDEDNALMLRQTQCHQSYTCDACEGECQNDQQCSGNLVCFKRNANKPFELIPGCLGTGVASKFASVLLVFTSSSDLLILTALLRVLFSARSYCYDPNLSRFADTSSNQGNSNGRQWRQKQINQQYGRTGNGGGSNMRANNRRNRTGRQRKDDKDDSQPTNQGRRGRGGDHRF